MTATTKTADTSPSIWVGALSAYNSGHLHGDWIDLSEITDMVELQVAVEKILATSPVQREEEWFIADYEGFYDYKVGQYDPLAEVLEVAHAIIDYGPAFAAFAYDELYGTNTVASVIEDFDERFLGEWGSVEKYIEDFYYEMYEHVINLIQEDAPSLLWAIDWGSVAREAEMDWLYSTPAPNYRVFLFRRY